MSLVYAWQKLFLAVGDLCGQGSQSERLIKATRHGLVHVRPEDLPVELRGEFIQLMHDLTFAEAEGKEASIQAAVESLDYSERENAVRTILVIFSAACRYLRSY